MHRMERDCESLTTANDISGGFFETSVASTLLELSYLAAAGPRSVLLYSANGLLIRDVFFKKMSKSPRRLISSISNSLSTTAEYLSMKRHGFGHDPVVNAEFERFATAFEAQTTFNAVLHDYSKSRTKQIASEVALVDAMNTLALRDGGNGAVVKMATRRQREGKNDAAPPHRCCSFA